MSKRFTIEDLAERMRPVTKADGSVEWVTRGANEPVNFPTLDRPSRSRLAWWLGSWALVWGLALLAWSWIAAVIYWIIVLVGAWKLRKQ